MCGQSGFPRRPVIALDEVDNHALQEKKNILSTLGASVEIGQPLYLPSGMDVLVVSPGLPPSHPVITQAIREGVPVWGELELAWRLQTQPTPWLCITGTNGKTTTTLMAEAIFKAAGYRAIAAGNIGTSLVELVMEPEPYDAFIVEVGAPQLPFVYSMSPYSAVCLNIAEDHIDHFGSMEAYVSAKAKVYERTQVAAIYNSSDEVTLDMVREADVVEGCRAIGFSLFTPGLSELGVVENLMVDRAFIDNRQTHAQELIETDAIHPAARHNIENALAAAALARSFGIEAGFVQKGLLEFSPAPHRVALVAEVDGIRFINDSKATNTHAAATALKSYESVLWIAGGDAKGQNFHDLVETHRHRMKHVFLVGRDQELLKQEFDTIAPEIPITQFPDPHPSALQEAVTAAADVAHAGDVVLLSPACASWDMFKNYGHRGDVFADAVHEWVKNHG